MATAYESEMFSSSLIRRYSFYPSSTTGVHASLYTRWLKNFSILKKGNRDRKRKICKQVRNQKSLETG